MIQNRKELLTAEDQVTNWKGKIFNFLVCDQQIDDELLLVCDRNGNMIIEGKISRVDGGKGGSIGKGRPRQWPSTN